MTRPQDDEQYSFEEFLGSGAFGTVWRAHDHVLNIPVAIKVLNASAESDSDTVREILTREATNQARVCNPLNPHPNVVYILGIRKFGGTVGIVMEFVDGLPVSALLEPDQPRVSTKRIVQIGIQICNGLEAAHRHKIIHRDIKPRNIIIRRLDDLVKIADWGVSKRLELAGISGTYAGTPPYMAPEVVELQYEPDKLVAELDHRVDVYSLGVTLFQLLSGELPFPHASPRKRASDILDGVQPRHRRILEKKGIDACLAAVVLKAMSRKPPDRYATAGELGEALLVHEELAAVVVHYRSGDVDSADVLSRQLLERCPENPCVYLESARIALLRHERDRALFLLNSGIERHPGFSALWNVRGRLHADMGLPQASTDFETALALGLDEKQGRLARATLNRLRRTTVHSEKEGGRVEQER